MVLFVDNIIAGLLAFFQLFAALQLRNDRIGLVILIGGFFRRAGDNQRGPGFVDKDRVNFVNHGKVMTALNAGSEIELHVVPQIIEAEFVVGAVGDVGGIGGLALEVVHVVLNAANFQTEEAIDLAHPFSVARGEIIIYRN